jgi:hypothetical protein
MPENPQPKPPTTYFLFEVGNVVKHTETGSLYLVLHHAVDHHDLGRRPMYVYQEISTAAQIYVNGRDVFESGLFEYYAKHIKAAP